MNIDLEKYLSVYAANHLKPYMQSDEVVKRAIENLVYTIETRQQSAKNTFVMDDYDLNVMVMKIRDVSFGVDIHEQIINVLKSYGIIGGAK